MFTMADILQGENGNVLMLIPEKLPKGYDELVVRLRVEGFDVEADGYKIGSISEIGSGLLDMLKQHDTMPVLECVEGQEVAETLSHYATIIDGRA